MKVYVGDLFFALKSILYWHVTWICVIFRRSPTQWNFIQWSVAFLAVFILNDFDPLFQSTTEIFFRKEYFTHMWDNLIFFFLLEPFKLFTCLQPSWSCHHLQISYYCVYDKSVSSYFRHPSTALSQQVLPSAPCFLTEPWCFVERTK